MPESPPPRPKHPAFHRTTMIAGFLIAAAAFAAGGISIRAEMQGHDTGIAGWIAPAMIAMLIGWFFFRALLARPRCPTCKVRAIHQRDLLEEIPGSRSPQASREFRCPRCGVTLIPGLDAEG